jgi:glycosyltransferase involved in cell wall biosynthesis
MKVSFVTPRYGTEVVGGAELGARMLAERLAQLDGWDVEALTTCAIDTSTWENAYEPGESQVNGVRVHRFTSRSGRHPSFEETSEALFEAPWSTVHEQRRWFELQGPVSDELVDAVATTDADVVVFYPYLYDPTFRGLILAGRRSVLHPAAHDEAPLQLSVLHSVFRNAGGLVFQTWSERRLVERTYPIGATPQLVRGLGVEEGPGEPDAARAAIGLDDRPYLLCLGRVDEGKGTRGLVEFFARYKERRPGPLRLVLAGPIVHDPPRHPDVVVAGPVDEPVKWGLLRGACALVNPSRNEAFSLVLVEAWTVGLPVIVNGRCEPTREHCERSGGGLWFDEYARFEVVVDRIAGDACLRARLGECGKRYVDRTFRWPVLIERYATFLRTVAERAAS